MTLLYSLYIDSLTVPIPEHIAKNLCEQIQYHYQKKNFVYWKCLCHFCDEKGYKDGKNNRGCSLINHIFDKLNSNEL